MQLLGCKLVAILLICVLVCPQSFCSAVPAKLVVVPQTVEDVEPGSTIVMTCVAFGDPLTSITWKRGNDIITNDMPDVTIYTSSISYGLVNFTQGVLEVCNMTSAYGGEYSCMASNDEANDTSSWNISVRTLHTRPTVLIVPSNVEVEYDSTIVMTCVASGDPPPQMRWERNGVEIAGSLSENFVFENGSVYVESFLEVCSIQSRDAGVYGCSASNIAGRSGLHQWQLDVSEIELDTFILLANSIDIHRISLDTDTIVDYVLPVSNVTWAASIDWDDQSNQIFWTDLTLDTISVANLDGSNQHTLLSNVQTPAGLAIDWITRKMYWTDDSGLERIEVAELDGSNRAIVVTNLDKPKAITVHPTAGIMFWTDWGVDPKIERANLDGSNRVVIVTEDLIYPNGLALDFGQERIFWCGTGRIESTDFNGNSRIILFNTSLSHPFGLTIHNEWIYWTDWDSHSLERANKDTGGQRSIVLQELDMPMDVHVFHRNRTRLDNHPCRINNGGCSHLCLGRSGNSTYGYVEASCFCPTGYVLKNDRLTCRKYTGSQVIIKTEGNPVITTGSTAMFVCVVTGNPLPTVEWHYEGNPLTNSSRMQVFSEVAMVTGTEMVQSVLEICSLEESDTGLYECVGRNPVSKDSAAVSLTVTTALEAEIIIWSDPVTTVPEGSTTLLVCVATGYPYPQMSWLKNGTQLTNATDDVTIYVTGIEDSGVSVMQSVLEVCGVRGEEVYTCMATNSKGEDSMTFDLNTGIGSQVIIKTEENPLIITGSTAMLVCVVTGNPLPTLEWHYEGNPLANSSRIQMFSEVVMVTGTEMVQSVLEICSLEESDTGLYKCVGRNPVSKDSAAVSLTVTTAREAEIILRSDPVTTVYESSTTLLVCVATGYPYPQMSWLKNGTQLTNATVDVTIYVTGIEESDVSVVQSVLEVCGVRGEEVYTCMATNSEGEDSMTFDLNAGIGSQVIIKTEENPVIFTGSTAMFVCVVTGNPLPTVEWYYEGNPPTNSSRIQMFSEVVMVTGTEMVQSVLEICSLEESDTGLYECVGRNPVSRDSAAVNLTVTTAREAEIVLQSDSVTTVPEGSTTLLVCVAKGYPYPQLSWLKNGTQITNATDDVTIYVTGIKESGVSVVQSVLEVCGVRGEEVYTCMATNSEGEDSMTFDLNTAFVGIGSQVIIKTEENPVIITGSAAMFFCVVTGNPLPTVEWYYEGNPLTNSSRIQMFSEVVMVTGTEMVQSVLEICSLEESDTGLYECVGRNPVSRDSAAVNLTVVTARIGSQVIIKTEENPVITTGSTAMFVCLVTGNPLPTVEWHYEGNPLANSSRMQVFSEVVMVTGTEMVQSVLEICSLEESDTGLYECVGRNPVSRDSAAVNLTVATAREAEIILWSDPVTTVYESSTTLLVCVATGYPYPQMSWLKNGTQLTNATDDVTIYVTGIAESGVSVVQSVLEVCGVRGEEVYTCMATNSEGEDSMTFDLNTAFVGIGSQVIIKTEENPVITTGSTAMLVCVVTGNPLPTVEWYYEGHPLTNSSRIEVFSEVVIVTGTEMVQSVLEICSLEESDTGLYECVGRNPVSRDSAAVNLTVATVREAEIILWSDPVTTVLESSTTLLVCVATGYPYPQISWLKNGTQLTNATDDVTIYVTGIEESGVSVVQSVLEVCGVRGEEVYTCVATNSEGEDLMTFDLVGGSGAQVIIKTEENPVIFTGSTAMFVCVVTGNPLPTVEWYYEGNPLTNSSRIQMFSEVVMVTGTEMVQSVLEICSLEESDTGLYECVGRNHVSRDSAAVNLTVTTAPMAQVVIAPDWISLDVHSSAFLVCVGHGSPVPVVTWFQEGEVIKNNSRDGRVLLYEEVDIFSGQSFLVSYLEVCGAEGGDGGRYVCKVENNGATDRQSFMVEIIAEGAPPQIIVSPPLLTDVDGGSTLTFVCVAMGDDLTQITWLRGGATPLYGDTRYTITNEPLQGGVVYSTLEVCGANVKDTGVYRCVASNGRWNDTVTFELQVAEKASIVLKPEDTKVNARETIILSCIGKGEYPEFSWLLGGVALNDTNNHVTIQDDYITEDDITYLHSTLTLCSAHVSDMGVYRCELTSRNTTDRADFHLTVITEPAALVIVPPASIQIRLFSSIALTCVASGYPLPVISWARVNGTELIQEGGDVNVTSSVIEVAGKWYVQSMLFLCQRDIGLSEVTCMATNGISGEGVITSTVAMNVRGTCIPETEEFVSSGKNRGQLIWKETEFGEVASAQCPCTSMDLQRIATRVCGGNTTFGGVWEEAKTDMCELTELGWMLCSDGGGAVGVVSELSSDSNLIGPSEVTLVTELIERLLNASLGNATLSNIVLTLIDNLLKGAEGNFRQSQEEFNTTGRLLAVLDLITDNYPVSSTSEPESISLDTFSLLIFPPVDTKTFPGQSIAVSSSGELSSDQPQDPETSSTSLQIPSSLFRDLSVPSETQIAYTAFKKNSLFIRRRSYLESSNRTSYRVGSAVLSARVSGGVKVTGLSDPVTLTFLKDETLKNGSLTECSYWHQLKDGGYGGWSTDGCRLKEDTIEHVTCVCDHLTSFTIVIDSTPSKPPPVTEANISRYTSIGSVVLLVCVAVVFISYLAKGIRSTPTGIFLLNLCLSLFVTFFLSIISQYVTKSLGACVFFAALFHYSILVSTLALAPLALFMTYVPCTNTKKNAAFTVTLVINWVLPVVIVVLSLAPDSTKYMSSEFCRPVDQPFWFGLLLPATLFMLLTAIVLVAIPIVKRRAVAKGSHDPWLREFVGLLLVYICYFVAWGFGLPAMVTLGNSVMRILFQVIYILASSLLGVFLLLFFMILSKQIRSRWAGLARRLCKHKAIGVYEFHENDTTDEETDKKNIYTESPVGASFPSAVPAAVLEMEQMTHSPKSFKQQASSCLSYSNPITDETEMFEKCDLSSVEEKVVEDVDGGEGSCEDVSGVDKNVYLDFPSTFKVEEN